MRIRIYKISNKELIGEYNLRSTFEGTFYHRNMPTISAKRCKKILDSVCPHMKIESEMFVLENVKTGHTGIQSIYRNGTIINF